MENIKEIYSDGIGKIHFIGGMLRLDLFSFNPDQEDAAGKPKPGGSESSHVSKCILGKL